jgi:hypothetical protein
MKPGLFSHCNEICSPIMDAAQENDTARALRVPTRPRRSDGSHRWSHRMSAKAIVGHLRGQRSGVTAGVFGVAVATWFVIGGSAYLRGRAIDPTERFFQEAGRRPSGGEGAIAAVVQYALFSAEHNDVIFVGDSACGTGIDPIRLRRLAGLQSFVLATPGIGARAGPLATRGYLARHPKPRAFVLCLSPLGLEVDSGQWADMLRRVMIFYDLEIDRVVPLTESVPYLVRSGVRALAAYPDYRALPLANNSETDTYFDQQATIFAARGFQGLPPRAEVQIPPTPTGVLIREDWDRGVHEMADTCAAAGVRMLILFTPIEAGYKDARDFERLDRWGRELEQTHAGLTVQRPIILAYEPGLMWDPVHLNLAGVEKFMPVVAKAVQEALAH